jgi:chemotaxis response regulator CheB
LRGGCFILRACLKVNYEESPVSPLRVLLVQSASLLNDVLQDLLFSGSELKVVTSEARDIQELTGDIARSEPDVVVLVDWLPVTGEKPLAENETLAVLMNTRANLRVIVISQNSNWLKVFRKDDVLLSHAADLIDVINSG